MLEGKEIKLSRYGDSHIYTYISKFLFTSSLGIHKKRLLLDIIDNSIVEFHKKNKTDELRIPCEIDFYYFHDLIRIGVLFVKIEYLENIPFKKYKDLKEFIIANYMLIGEFNRHGFKRN